MIFNQDDREIEREREIMRDMLSGRKFSLAEAIGREGSGFLKGESPVPKLVQATTEINNFITRNLVDSSGALQAILYIWVKNDLRVSQNFKSPLIALNKMLRGLIDNENLFYEFVKEVDRQWGQMYDERPYFQQPGQAPHPNDEYTHESVRLQLLELLDKLKKAGY